MVEVEKSIPRKGSFILPFSYAFTNYRKGETMNSIEDQLNRIESGGWEAFFDEDLKDPAFAKDLHIKASAKGMSDLDYANEQEALDQLYELDSDAWWLEDQDLSEFIVDENGNPNVNDAREIFDNLVSGEWTGAYNTSCKDDPEGALIETIEGYETCLSDANIPLGGFADGCGGGIKHALDFLAQFKDNPICKHCKIYFDAISNYARQLNAIAQEFGLNDYIITIPGNGAIKDSKKPTKRVKEMARTYKNGVQVAKKEFDNDKAIKLFKKTCADIGADLVRDQDITVAAAIDRQSRYYVQLKLATNYSPTEYVLETYKKGKLTNAWEGNTMEEFIADLEEFATEPELYIESASRSSKKIREMAKRLSSYSDMELAVEFVGQYCAVFDMGKMGFSSNPRAYKLLEECEKRFGNFRHTTCFDKEDIDMCTILVSKFEEMNEENDCGNSIGAIYRAANKTWGPYKDWVRSNWRGITSLDPALVDECWEAQRKIYNK